MSDNIITPLFRASFVNLFEATSFKDDKRAKFSITALIPVSLDDYPDNVRELAAVYWGDGLARIKAGLRAACVKKWADIPGDVKSPIHRQAAKADKYEGYTATGIYIKLSTINTPGVVDASVQKIIDPSKIYSGMWGIASVSFRTYTEGGNGVAIDLINFQKLADDAHLGGTATDPKDDFQPAPGASTPSVEWVVRGETKKSSFQ